MTDLLPLLRLFSLLSRLAEAAALRASRRCCRPGATRLRPAAVSGAVARVVVSTAAIVRCDQLAAGTGRAPSASCVGHRNWTRAARTCHKPT